MDGGERAFHVMAVFITVLSTRRRASATFRRLSVGRRPRSRAEPPDYRGGHPIGYPGRRRIMADPGTPGRSDNTGLRIGRADKLRTDPELVRDLFWRVGGPKLEVPHAGCDDHGHHQQHGADGERELEASGQCRPG